MLDVADVELDAGMKSFCALATMPEEISTPITCAPRRVASAASAPEPLGTSSRRTPARNRTASRSGAMASAVTGPKNPM